MAAETRSESALPAEAEMLITGRRSRVSWGGILAGFVCALAIQAVFALAGLAWGLGTIEPAEEARPLAGLAVGGGIYWVVSSVISVFVGGWIAARLAAQPFTITSILHGIAVWALATLFLIVMGLSIAGMAARTAARTAQAAAAAAASVGGEAVELAAGAVSAQDRPLIQQIRDAARQRDMTAQDIREELREMYREVITEREQRRAGEIVEETARTIVRTPGDISTDISTGLDRLFGGPEAVLNERDRAQLVSAIAKRFDIPEREAEQIVNRWQTRWQEASRRLETAVENAQAAATKAAERAADTASNTSISLAIASLLGLIAAAIGGALGRIGLGTWPVYGHRGAAPA